MQGNECLFYFLDLNGKWRNDLPCGTPLGVLCQGGPLTNSMLSTRQETSTGNIIISKGRRTINTCKYNSFAKQGIG